MGKYNHKETDFLKALLLSEVDMKKLDENGVELQKAMNNKNITNSEKVEKIEEIIATLPTNKMKAVFVWLIIESAIIHGMTNFLKGATIVKIPMPKEEASGDYPSYIG